MITRYAILSLAVINLLSFTLASPVATSPNPMRQLHEDYRNMEDYKKFYSKTDITCTQTNCPSPNYCISASVCECALGRANVESLATDNTVYCQYKQKKQMTAFLLSFFIFFGAGEFYIERNDMAIPQLFFTMIPFVILCLTICISCQKDADGRRPMVAKILMVLFGLFTLGVIAWYFVEVGGFAANMRLDGNEVPLQEW